MNTATAIDPGTTPMYDALPYEDAVSGARCTPNTARPDARDVTGGDAECGSYTGTWFPERGVCMAVCTVTRDGGTALATVTVHAAWRLVDVHVKVIGRMMAADW
jgi:hypothetical protein